MRIRWHKSRSSCHRGVGKVHGSGPCRLSAWLVCTLYLLVGPPPSPSSAPHHTCLPSVNDESRDTINIQAFTARKQRPLSPAQPRSRLHGLIGKRRTGPTRDARCGQATNVKPLTHSHGAQIGARTWLYATPWLGNRLCSCSWSLCNSATYVVYPIWQSRVNSHRLQAGTRHGIIGNSMADGKTQGWPWLSITPWSRTSGGS